MAQHLLAAGLHGQRVLLTAKAEPGFLVSFYASLAAGAVPLPAYTPTKHRRAALRSIIEAAAPAAILSSKEGLSQMATRAQEIGIGASTLMLDWEHCATAPDLELPSVRPTDLAFLQFSSGSTAAPKGVRVLHHQLLANLAKQARALSHPEGAPIVSWLPLHHDMGLVGQMLWGMYLGAPVTLMSPLHFFEQPLRWLRAIQRYGAYTAGGPNFAYEACLSAAKHQDLSDLDLSAWKVAFNGAEPVRMATMRSFSDRFAAAGFSERAWAPSYGLAECCVFVSADAGEHPPREYLADAQALARGEARVASASDRSQSLVCCGYPEQEDELSIVEIDGHKVLPEGQVGEIVIRSASVADGYWEHPQATSECFELSVGGAANKLRTGDLGFVQDGGLYITGRCKDLIISRGQNIYPHDLEVLLSDPSWQEHVGLCAAIGQEGPQGEEVWIVCELRRKALSDKEDYSSLARKIRSEVAARSGVELAAVLLIRPAGIPRTSSGKVQRRATAQRIQQGDLSFLHCERFVSAPEGQGAANALELVREFLRLRVGEVELSNKGALELGLGSLDCALLAQSLAAHWGVQVDLLALMQAPDLEAWIRERQEQRSLAMTPPSAETPDDATRYPMTAGQQAIWAVHQNASDPGVYNLHLVLEISGAIAPSRLQQAFEALMCRHPVLRTRVQGGQAQVEAAASASLDWQALRYDPSTALSTRITQLIHEPFDLCQDYPMRLRWISQGEGGTLVWVMHHIAVDFWSLVTLVREFKALLVQPDKVPPAPKHSYAQWASLQRRHMEARAPQDWSYWSRRLGEKLPASVLPLDYPREQGLAHRGAVHHLRLEKGLVASLDELSRRCGLSRYRLYLALFGLALARRGAQRDLLIGTPITGREDARWRDVVGYFVNPAAIRFPYRDREALEVYLRRVGERVHEALAHRTLPFAQIVERLAPERNSHQWPLYQVAFTYQESHDPELAPLAALALQDEQMSLDWGELSLRHAPIHERVENFDLKLVMAGRGESVVAAFQYNRALLDPRSVEGLAREFEALAKSVAGASLDAPLASLQGAAVEQSTAPKRIEPEAITELHLARRWHARVAQGPERIAVESAEGRYSFAQLDQWSAQLAQQMRAQGLRRGQRVGVEMSMQPAFVAAALACVRMGLTYVPIDPNYPEARRRWIVQDADLQGVWLSPSAVPGARRWPMPECPAPGQLSGSAPELSSPHRAEVAYLIYTSGSTGTPKGVEISHGALLSLVDWHHQRYQSGAQTRAAPTASVGFDASVWELWPHLLGGCTLVIPAPDLLRNPPAFLDWAARSRIDTLFLPTALLEACLQLPWPPKLNLAHLLTGGDRLAAVQAQLRARGQLLHNHYGPTECAVVATVQPLQASKDQHEAMRLPPIGRALPGVQTLLLDAQLQRVSDGALADLYLAGAQLAQGYAHQPRLTAQRFVPNPFGAPGDRMYDSGDRVRRGPAGELHFEGRKDAQLQIRGQRVEPGELESWLGRQVEVQSARVIARKDRHGGVGLFAYLLPAAFASRADASLVQAQLKDWEELYEQTYEGLAQGGGQRRDAQDLVGWQESAHGQAIDASQMWNWVQDSVESISRLQPRALLEIGSGSGLLAKALAPELECYIATDISSKAVEHLREWAEREACASLRVGRAAAHEVLRSELLGQARDRIDTVVLNSVVQYFPSSQYLIDLVVSLCERLPSLRAIYLGDLRDAQLLRLFHQDNAWSRSGDRASLLQVDQKAAQLVAMDRELCLSPQWWLELTRSRLPGWQGLPQLREGDYENELSRYRFDFVLRREDTRSEAESWEQVDLRSSPDSPSMSQIMDSVARPVRVGGLADARLRRALQRDAALHPRDCAQRGFLRVQDIHLGSDDPASELCFVDPHTLSQQAHKAGLRFLLTPAKGRRGGEMELWIAPPEADSELFSLASQHCCCGVVAVHEPWESRLLAALPEMLAARARQELPAQLLPQTVVALAQWPLTAHAKLDERALEALQPDVQQLRAPETPAEELLCSIYAQVLGLGQVGTAQNFFSLGGDSILAIQIASRLRERGWELSSGEILDHPTIAELAPRLRKAVSPEVEAGSQREAALTPMQQGLWIEQDGAPQAYVESITLRFRGPLQPKLLREAWFLLLQRHDALRCAFEWNAQGGVQRLVSFGIEALDWRELEPGAQAQEPRLDLSRAPVMAWRVMQRAQDDWELQWVHSHLLLDGWSVASLIGELMQHYDALQRGAKCSLPAAPSFLKWAQQQRKEPSAPQASSYWRGLAARWQSAQQQPLGGVALGSKARVNLELAPRVAQMLRRCAAQAQSTLSTLVQSAWIELWGQIRGQRNLCVGMVDSGREAGAPGIESMVGLLIRSIPLVVEAQSERSWREIWCQRAEEIKAARAHAGAGGSQELARWLGAERGGLLWDCLLAVENYPRQAVEHQDYGGVRLESAEHRGCTHYPLTLVVGVHEKITLDLEYASALLDADAAASWLGALAELLESAARDPKAPASTHVDMLALGTLRAPRQLGASSSEAPPKKAVPGRAALQALLLQLWAQALNRPEVDPDDDFFALGGDSIVAMTLVQALRNHGWRCSVQDLLSARSPRRLLGVLQPMDESSGAGFQSPATPRRFEPIWIQRWLLDQNLAAPHHFNQALRLPVPEGVSPQRMQAALDGLAAHHAALRCNLEGDAQRGWAFVLQDSAQERWPLREVDLRGCPSEQARSRLAQASEQMQGSFELGQGALFGALFVHRDPPRGNLLILAAHHLVVDAVSWRILLGDLQLLVEDPSANLPVPTQSFALWSAALARYGQGPAQAQLDYWSSFGGEQEVLQLPAAPHDPGLVKERAFLAGRLDLASSAALVEQGTQRYRAKLQELLLASLAASLCSWSLQGELVIDVEGHGRHQDVLDCCVDRTVGWFTTQFPLRIPVSDEQNWSDRIEAVKRSLRAMPDYGLGYGALRLRGQIPESPAQISWNYLGKIDSSFAGASSMLGGELAQDDEIGPCHGPENRCAYLIDINLCLIEDRIQIHLAYGPSLAKGQMQRWLDQWMDALRSLARSCQQEPCTQPQVSDFELVLDQIDSDDLQSILKKVQQ